MYGCPKIALLASNVLSISVDQCLVRRILLKHYKPTPGSDPSWLLPIGWKADKLWTLDFFRVESINLKTHWVMVVMDQFSRKIIGFSVHDGALDGPTACYMFNSVLSENTPPSNLSSDNDPLFRYHRWLANLEELEIEEIKSIPFTPTCRVEVWRGKSKSPIPVSTPRSSNRTCAANASGFHPKTTSSLSPLRPLSLAV